MDFTGVCTTVFPMQISNGVYATFLVCKLCICVENIHAVEEKAAGRGPLGLTEGRGGMADTAGLE